MATAFNVALRPASSAEPSGPVCVVPIGTFIDRGRLRGCALVELSDDGAVVTLADGKSGGIVAAGASCVVDGWLLELTGPPPRFGGTSFLGVELLPRLALVAGPDVGARPVELALAPREGPPTTIGRDPGCDLVLKDLAVSNRHCEIRFDAATEEFRLTDFSTNGTIIGGRKLHRDQSVRLTHGVEIACGGSRLEFRFPGAALRSDPASGAGAGARGAASDAVADEKRDVVKPPIVPRRMLADYAKRIAPAALAVAVLALLAFVAWSVLGEPALSR
jgi:hypothetical protein